jgi:serine phosphatase RsbU (regulator of sigma subunit)
MSLADLLVSIMDVAKEMLKSEGSSLLLADKRSGDLIFDVVIGDKGDIILGEKVPRGKGIAGTVATTLEPIIVDDAQKDTRFYQNIDRKSHFHTRNILCVPMLMKDEFVGVLEIVNSIGRESFNEWDLEKARYIADQAAIAINNRRLYDDLKNRVEELTALYEVSQSISFARKEDDILHNILESITNSMKVQRASLVMFDDEFDKLVINSAIGLPEYIKPGHEVDIDNTITGLVFRSGDPMIVSDIKGEVSAELLNDDRTYVTDSFLSVPIHYKNETIGVLSLADKEAHKFFDSFDLRLITTASTQISAAFQNIKAQKEAEEKRMLAREIDIAAEIQRKTLQEVPTNYGSHKIAAFNKPAKVVGGDFYDYYEFDNNKYSVLIADISGKGIPAALFMGTARNVVRAERRIEYSPAHLLKNANRFIYQDSEYGMFVTLFYVVIDSHNNLITYGSAGHNDQILIKQKKGEIIKLNAEGKALGMIENQEYEEKVILYDPGDMLVLYTDGVTESFGGNRMDIEHGEEELCKIIKKYIKKGPSDMIDYFKDYLEENSIDAEFLDDFTIMAIQF